LQVQFEGSIIYTLIEILRLQGYTMKAITNTLIFLSTNVMCSSFYVRRGQHEDHLASDTHLTLDTVMGGRSLEEQPVTHLSSNTFMKKEIEENMGNVWEPFDEKSDTAYFWQIPRAGSTNALAYFSICMNMTEASRMGISSQSDRLEVVQYFGHNFVNVDVSSQEGLKHAKELNLPASHLADVVSSPYASEVMTGLFDQEHRGKMFALLRHPIERLASKFYYLQTATHERSYNPEFAKMTLEEYAQIPKYLGDNWMTRMLVGKLWEPLEHHDLEIANEILKKKCLVGLQENMQESLERFETYFGWKLIDLVKRDDTLQTGEECKRSFLYGSEKEREAKKFNAHQHPKVEQGSPAWELLAKASKYDMELYKTAVDVFEHQGQLFQNNDNTERHQG